MIEDDSAAEVIYEGPPVLSLYAQAEERGFAAGIEGELSQLRERLAAFAHEQWSGWMKYMFGLTQRSYDNLEEIPEQKSVRWKRQMITPYSELPENEKDSDRVEADRFISFLCEWLRRDLRPDPSLVVLPREVVEQLVSSAEDVECPGDVGLDPEKHEYAIRTARKALRGS